MISVIVLIYNVDKYLHRCIDSIIHQSYSDLEIILVDDGSTDSSPVICDTYASVDKRVQVIHQENKGVSSARNTGIGLATGEYIAFVDGDDYILPNMYERMLNSMQASDADIVMCGFLNVDESGCYLGKANVKEWTGSGTEFLKNDGLVYDSVWNKLYCRFLFDDVRFPSEDIVIMHDVFLKASKVSTISNLFYVHLQKEGSISPGFLETLVGRIEILLTLNAGERAVFYYVKQLYATWNKCNSESMFLLSWKDAFLKFRRITKGVSKNWSLSNKFYLVLFRIHPRLLKLLLWNLRVIRKFVLLCRRIVAGFVKYSFAKNYSNHKGDVYKSEYDKYKLAMKSDNSSLIVRRMEAFSSDEIVLKNDKFSLSDDPCVPTVVVVVKNELERMKLFYTYYRRLGVHQFVVLDNDSTDGTLEFLMEQIDTRVYQTCASFQTQRKEGWIEKILAMTGYNRWYIVVDSDELLDYIGSETHSVENLVRNVHSSGIRRICGYMLDMYSQKPLFDYNSRVSDIQEYYRYFDNEGYYKKMGNYIIGGPRLRKFGTYLVLSKQAIFYFDEQTLYRDCHSLFPAVSISEMPMLFVLRHYKFLNKDYEEYQRRIKEGSFYNNSIEYRSIMNHINKNDETSLYYYNSCEYNNSESLRCLPYLEEMNW